MRCKRLRLLGGGETDANVPTPGSSITVSRRQDRSETACSNAPSSAWSSRSLPTMGASR